MWTENLNFQEMGEWFVIGDTMQALANGIYKAYPCYYGAGDNAGLTIWNIGSYWIISEKRGDSLELEENIGYGASGIYDKGTFSFNGDGIILSNESNHIVYNGDLYFWAGRIGGADDVHEAQRTDRSGAMISMPNQLMIEFTESDGFISYDDSSVEFALKSGESLTTIKNEAEDSFDQKGYYIRCFPAGGFSGWLRVGSSPEGVYESFGDESGQKKVGYYRYRDDFNNVYVLEFDIKEVAGDWVLTYPENGQKYSTGSRPTDANTTFSNSEAVPSSIILNFDSYVSKDGGTINYVTNDGYSS